jgi:hypothetical protein
MAVLVLAGALTVVISKTWASHHRGEGSTIHDRVADDTLRLRRQEARADELGARAHAAEVEIDIKTVRACNLQQQVTDSRIAVAAARDELNHLRRQAETT